MPVVQHSLCGKWPTFAVKCFFFTRLSWTPSEGSATERTWKKRTSGTTLTSSSITGWRSAVARYNAATSAATIPESFAGHSHGALKLGESARRQPPRLQSLGDSEPHKAKRAKNKPDGKGEALLQNSPWRRAQVQPGLPFANFRGHLPW